MATQASWAREVPAVNHNGSFEIEDAAIGESRARQATNSAAADYPALSVTAPLSGAYSEWCGSWRRPTPQY